jgi:urease accessory protein
MVMAIMTMITAMAIITTITKNRSGAAQQALYRLLTWLSPAYPVGAYTYSHGLEAAVEAGAVTKRDGLDRLCRHGFAARCGARGWRAAGGRASRHGEGR